MDSFQTFWKPEDGAVYSLSFYFIYILNYEEINLINELMYNYVQ